MKLPKPGENFEPAPIGNHVAICYQVVDLGTQETTFGPKRQIQFAWELPLAQMDDGRPHIVRSQPLTLSGDQRSNLRQMLESWRGVAFTEDDFETFSIENVLGAACLLNVVHNESDSGTVFANVAAVTPVPRGTPVPPPVNVPVFVSLDEFDQDAFAELSEWMQAKIAKSPEFADIVAAREQHDAAARQRLTQQAAPQHTSAQAARLPGNTMRRPPASSTLDDDPDVPF